MIGDNINVICSMILSKLITKITVECRYVCATADAQTCFTLGDYTFRAALFLRIDLGT